MQNLNTLIGLNLLLKLNSQNDAVQLKHLRAENISELSGTSFGCLAFMHDKSTKLTKKRATFKFHQR